MYSLKELGAFQVFHNRSDYSRYPHRLRVVLYRLYGLLNRKPVGLSKCRNRLARSIKLALLRVTPAAVTIHIPSGLATNTALLINPSFWSSRWWSQVKQLRLSEHFSGAFIFRQIGGFSFLMSMPENCTYIEGISFVAQFGSILNLHSQPKQKTPPPL